MTISTSNHDLQLAMLNASINNQLEIIMTTVSLTQTQESSNVNTAVRLLLGALLSLLSIGLFLLAFPPYTIWPLVLFAFVPMLVSQYRVMPAKYSSLASAITIGGWLGIFFQNIFSINGTQADLVWWMQGLPIIIGTTPMCGRTDARSTVIWRKAMSTVHLGPLATCTNAN